MAGALPRSITVLHVDDEPAVAELAAEYIERHHERFEVDTATTVSEGATELVRNEYDCIVSDFDMPDTDGIEFLRTVREEHPDLPFVLYTGKGSEEVASEAISSGVTDYLQKESGTSQYDVLANRIRNAVSQFYTRKELDRSQDLLEHTEQLADVGGWEAEVETGELRWTEGTYTIHDLDPDSAFDPTVETGVGFYHPDDQPEIRECVDRCTEDGEPYEVELRILTAEDHLRWVRSSGEPVRDEGEIVAIRGAIRDITERKEREKELTRRNQELQGVLDGVEAAIWIRDLDSRFVLVNQNFLELFGFADEDAVVGKRLSALFSEELADQFRSNDQRVIAAEEQVQIQEEVETEQGVREYLTRITPLYDDGELFATCGVASDITTQKRRERELQRQNERLDEFVGVVSHDLRNPLEVAEGRVDLAADERESEHLDTAARALNRMEELIENTLSLARAGRTVGETEAVELATLVEACWENVETAEARLVVQTDAVVQADQTRSQQLLENLLRNAVEHGGPTVTITVGDLPDGFYVEDDGPGLPADQREGVFEPGYTTRDDGTGFGLSIVRDIAQAHGWEIDAAEGAAGGARFEFTGVERQ